MNTPELIGHHKALWGSHQIQYKLSTHGWIAKSLPMSIKRCRFISRTNWKRGLARPNPLNDTLAILYWNQFPTPGIKMLGSRMTSVSIRHVVLSTPISPCFFYDVKYDIVVICGLYSNLWI